MRSASLLFSLLLSGNAAYGQTEANQRDTDRKESLRHLELKVEEKGWGEARHSDLSAVLRSSCSEIAVHFGASNLKKLEPLRVRRGESGPITHYKRTVRGEIMILLNSKDRFWCQHAYQMAHEFCHVLCGYKNGDRSNLWFEESICELASIFALREMAKSWKTAPPYPNWKSYTTALEDYAADLFEKFSLPEGETLETWYRAHAVQLRENATNRALNGVVAIQLLPLFESKPENWQAISWLNHGRGDKKQTFREYLRNWHQYAPEEQKPFVIEVGKAFGILE